MKVKIKGYVTHTKYKWDEAPQYTFHGFDPSDYLGDESVVVMQHEIEIEIPDDFDPRPGQIAALKAQKERAQAEFAKRVTEIDEKINSLLALEA